MNVLSRKRRRTCSANPQFGGKCGWSSARIIGLGECPVKAGFHGPIHGGVGILPASIAIPVNETQGYLHDVEKVSHLITFWLTPLETQSQIARILAVVWRLRGAVGGEETAHACENARFRQQSDNSRGRGTIVFGYCSFAYSAVACLRMGMSGPASSQSVQRSGFQLGPLLSLGLPTRGSSFPSAIHQMPPLQH